MASWWLGAVRPSVPSLPLLVSWATAQLTSKTLVLIGAGLRLRQTGTRLLFFFFFLNLFELLGSAFQSTEGSSVSHIKECQPSEPPSSLAPPALRIISTVLRGGRAECPPSAPHSKCLQTHEIRRR